MDKLHIYKGRGKGYALLVLERTIKMKKRVLALLVALAMLFSMLTGCGKKIDLSVYDGVWAEEDLSYENGGFIMTVTTDDDVTTLFCEYADEGSGTTSGGVSKEITSKDIRKNVVTIEGVEDDWGNVVDMKITFNEDAVVCEVTEIEEGDAIPVFYKGTYTLVRNEEALQILSETPWEETMGVKADDYAEEPVQPTYDTSKASGILASLGMTENEFRVSCKRLFSAKSQIGTPKGDEVWYSDLVKYPNNYLNNHFVIDNLSGYDFQCDYKGISDDGYTHYEDVDSYNYDAIIYDFRDDVYSPNFTSGSYFRPYVIFKGLHTINGDDWLVFWMISVDTSEEMHAQEEAERAAKKAQLDAEAAEKAKKREAEAEEKAKQKEIEEQKKKEEAEKEERERVKELQDATERLKEMNS